MGFNNPFRNNTNLTIKECKLQKTPEILLLEHKVLHEKILLKIYNRTLLLFVVFIDILLLFPFLSFFNSEAIITDMLFAGLLYIVLCFVSGRFVIDGTLRNIFRSLAKEKGLNISKDFESGSMMILSDICVKLTEEYFAKENIDMDKVFIFNIENAMLSKPSLNDFNETVPKDNDCFIIHYTYLNTETFSEETKKEQIEEQKGEDKK